MHHRRIALLCIAPLCNAQCITSMHHRCIARIDSCLDLLCMRGIPFIRTSSCRTLYARAPSASPSKHSPPSMPKPTPRVSLRPLLFEPLWMKNSDGRPRQLPLSRTYPATWPPSAHCIKSGSGRCPASALVSRCCLPLHLPATRHRPRRMSPASPSRRCHELRRARRVPLVAPLCSTASAPARSHAPGGGG